MTTTLVGVSGMLSKNPQIGPFWLTPLGLSFGFTTAGLTAAFFLMLVGSDAVALAVSCEDCVWRDSEEVGRNAGDAAGDVEVDVGVAPHLPKNHPPELLPVGGPSLLRGPRFWFAIVEYRKERLSLLSALPCERLP